jgi:hypothetical protein
MLVIDDEAQVRTALTMIIGSAGLLQEFHRTLGPDEIELLAGGILEAALSIHRMAEDHDLDAEPGPPSGARPGPRRPRLSAATAGESRS